MARVIVAIAIGSNLGDRASHLAFACDRLDRLLTDFQTSSFIETEPVLMPDVQAKVLNAAAVGKSEGSPRALLSALMAIERERGRDRPFPGASRTLDLDLILFGDRVVSEDDLTVPHPRFRERAFVLEPLAEIAPALRDPVTGKTVAELLASLRLAKRGAEARRP